jgi:hypothetical protein
MPLFPLLSGVYIPVSGAFLTINILPHTDCLAVFVEKFAVLDKAVFFVKGKDTLVVFYVGVYGEEAGGAVIVIAGHCFVFGKL